jgi:hypothetical protein
MNEVARRGARQSEQGQSEQGQSEQGQPERGQPDRGQAVPGEYDAAEEPSLRRWLLVRDVRNRRLERRTGQLIVVIAILLTCWIFWLGSTLPPDPLQQQWSTAYIGLDNYSLTWVGLDCLEALGLAAAGLFFWHGSAGARTCALLSMPVFFLDAWFDVLTAVSRSDLVVALLMAAVGELPAVVGLGWIAWKARDFSRREAADRLHRSGLGFSGRPARWPERPAGT